MFLGAGNRSGKSDRAGFIKFLNGFELNQYSLELGGTSYTPHSALRKSNMKKA
jgi:hypothetical protein